MCLYITHSKRLPCKGKQGLKLENSGAQNSESTTVVDMVYMETQMGENHIMLSYISKITFIGSTNFQILQHQLEGGSNPLFIGSNLKEATTP
jgi:hypothetical protein